MGPPVARASSSLPAESQPTSLASRRRGGRIAPQWIPVFGAVAVGLVILAIAIVPVPHPFSFTIVTMPAPPYFNETALGYANLPCTVAGAAVSASWTTGGGVPVKLDVVDGASTVYSANGSSGSFSFTSTADCPEVLVSSSQVGETISLSGTYWSPEWRIAG
jgi:hypothetical protein